MRLGWSGVGLGPGIVGRVGQGRVGWGGVGFLDRVLEGIWVLLHEFRQVIFTILDLRLLFVKWPGLSQSPKNPWFLDPLADEHFG